MKKRSQKRNGRKNLGCYRIYWGLGVNLATGVAGRRIFDQPQSNTSIADARFAKAERPSAGR